MLKIQLKRGQEHGNQISKEKHTSLSVEFWFLITETAICLKDTF